MITGGDRVGDSLGHQSLPQVPLVRPAVQRRNLTGPGQRELVGQQIAEEVVVAIPLTALIERNQEQVGALQLHELPRGLATVQQRIA